MARDKATEDEARQKARTALAMSAAFQTLDRDEQRELYQNTIDEEYDSLARAKGLIADDDQFSIEMGERGASRQIDEGRYENKNLDAAGGRMADLVQSVNFPNFVRDLLKGVFDANMEVSIKQMEQYQELLKQATKSTAQFVKDVTKADSYAYLADNSSEFFMGFDDSIGGSGGEAVLKDKEGQDVDVNDDAVKAKIMDAQLAIAKERRKLLRETIMMGISRLVVEKGTVKASVVFDIKSKSMVTRADKATDSKKTAKTSVSQQKRWWWGGRTSNSTTDTQETQISISSAKGIQEDELKAKLTGDVEIIFKSDYFTLDNFADELEGTNVNRRPAAAGQAGGATTPPAQ